jgi:hypothetical protein
MASKDLRRSASGGIVERLYVFVWGGCGCVGGRADVMGGMWQSGGLGSMGGRSGMMGRSLSMGAKWNKEQRME